MGGDGAAWLVGLSSSGLSTKDVRGPDKGREESYGPPGALVKVPMQFCPLQKVPLIYKPLSHYPSLIVIK